MISDNYGRAVTSLRISIIKKCNLNCIYCHQEGETGPSGHEISKRMIERTVTAAAYLGVNKVKFSGGEPLLRYDFEAIISSLPALKDISATTNGVLLKDRAAKLADSGLDRVNISLPSMQPADYGKITGCSAALSHVFEGIDAAVDAGLTPVKLNMVLLRTLNDSKIDDAIRFAGKFDGKVILQLIELMNFKNLGHYMVDIDSIEQSLENRASEIKERHMHRRKKYFIDGVEVELVRPLDNSSFCGNCNRLRITSCGQIKSCLMRNDNLVDIPEEARVEDIKKLLEMVIEKREPYYKDQSRQFCKQF